MHWLVLTELDDEKIRINANRICWYRPSRTSPPHTSVVVDGGQILVRESTATIDSMISAVMADS